MGNGRGNLMNAMDQFVNAPGWKSGDMMVWTPNLRH